MLSLEVTAPSSPCLYGNPVANVRPFAFVPDPTHRGLIDVLIGIETQIHDIESLGVVGLDEPVGRR